MDNEELENFSLFDPGKDANSILPNIAGCYIITIMNQDFLPRQMQGLKYQCFNGHPVVYIGATRRGLRLRNYYEHFIGPSRKSTLRRSFGVVMGYVKVREQNSPKRYSFNEEGEKLLSDWMRVNLLVYYHSTDKPEAKEKELIKKFCPPLNLINNRTGRNEEFRTQLYRLRNKRKSKKELSISPRLFKFNCE